MASKFWLAVAGWLCCNFCGYRYGGREYNDGIGSTLFASICTMAVSWTTPDELPTTDWGYKAIAFSMVIWPGCIWGMALFHLLSRAKDQAACLWLILSPLLAMLLGMPVLRRASILRTKPDFSWRIAAGLSWIGIVIGHILSKSSVGHTIEHHISGLFGPLATSKALTTSFCAAIMFFSMARMVQSHSRTVQVLQLSKRIPVDTIIPFSFPPLWGVSGPWHAIAWTVALALCVWSLADPQARALLGSTSIAAALDGVPPSFCRSNRGTILRCLYASISACSHQHDVCHLCIR